MIPEYGNTLMATATIKQKVCEAGLNGFEFIDCENLRGYFG
jgi:hypothetical protein